MKTTLKTNFVKNGLLASLFLFVVIGCGREDDLENIELPTLTTLEIADYLQTNAVGGGNVTSDGGDSSIVRGVCWSTLEEPTINDFKTIDGKGQGSFTSNLVGLLPNTKYYVRAYATNRKGTEYGDLVVFTTLKPFPENGTVVKDFDNNAYHTIVIGKQVWLLENLKTAHYNNGDLIFQRESYNEDGNCWNFENSIENGEIYGKLYNWYAAKDTRGICPEGYRIPTNEDWLSLSNYLGGNTLAGGKLKESGLIHWKSPNTGATNESGFTALGAGIREMDGSFQILGSSTYFWSSTVTYPNSAQADGFALGSYDATCGINSVGYKTAGYSVRCIMIPFDPKN